MIFILGARGTRLLMSCECWETALAQVISFWITKWQSCWKRHN